MSEQAKPKRILIGDSESWALGMFEQAAAKQGLELHIVRNGIEAVERFRTLAPALVVMDTLLPKLDGLQVASKIHDMELGRITPIIITSAIFRRGPEVERLRRNFGFTDFLEKPFQQEQVEALLAAHLSEEPEAPAADAEVDEAGEPMRTPDHAELALSEMGIPALLMQLCRSRKDGVLTLRQGQITKVLFFQNGYLTHARSNSRRDLLGRILLKSRRIAMEDYDRARQLQLESSGHLQLGQALCQLGVLNEDEVINAVAKQILGIVFSLFDWRSGTWSFLETKNIPAPYTRFSFNPANIVFWGLRQLEGKVRFAPFLPKEKSIIEVTDKATALKDNLHLTYFEEQILGLVDAKRRLGEIVSIGQLAHLDVERVVFSLLVVGLLRVRREAATTDPEVAEEPAAESRPIDTQGDLTQTSVARLLARIANAGISGQLTFEHKETETTVWFDRGEIVYARSTAEEFRLANILLRAGKVTQADYDEAMRLLMDHTARKTGSIFLELRALSLEELHWALRFQVQAIVMSLFKWGEGTYSLRPGEPRLDLRVSLDATTPNLIMEGARSSPPPPGIVAMLRSAHTRLARVWGDYRVMRLLQLSSAEMRLLSFIDVGRSVYELRNHGLMSEDELARSLHGLLALEVIKASLGTGEAESTIPPPPKTVQVPLSSRMLGRPDDDDSDDDEEVTGEMKLDRVAPAAGEAAAGRGAGADVAQLRDENQALKDMLAKMNAELEALQRKVGDKAATGDTPAEPQPSTATSNPDADASDGD